MHGLTNEGDQTVQGILTITFLVAEAPGLDDENPLIGHAFAGQAGESVPDIPG